MTTDQSPDRLDGLRAEYANTGMVKYDGAVWLISQVVVLRERVQQLSAVPVPPPADQTASGSGRAAEAELYVLLRKAGEPRDEAQALIDRHRADELRRVAAEEQPAETQARWTAAIRIAALEEAAQLAVAENATCPAVGPCQPCQTRERVAAELLRAAERPAVGEQPETQETPNPRTVCTCGHTRGEHLRVSGRLLCDECDPNSTNNLVCRGFEAL